MKNKSILRCLFVMLTSGFVLSSVGTICAADPLPSWNDGPAKAAVTAFVGRVKVGGQKFVPIDERIAVFDNDGTLWTEQPHYVHAAFAVDRIKSLADRHPEWKEEQPFQGILENDLKTAFAGGERAIAEIVMASHAGMTPEEFEQLVTNWLATARHPRFNRPYTDLVYQPMLELMKYLRAHGFKTYIVSGGGIEFIRPWTERVYGIPPEQVFGSSIRMKFEFAEGRPRRIRLPEVDFIDDKDGKPVGIQKFNGRRPIAAFGNSDGDLQMLQWTTAGAGARFGLIVHHTDAEREWAYDRQSHVGRLDQAFEEARKCGWTMIDMKWDWKVIYPFQK